MQNSVKFYSDRKGLDDIKIRKTWLKLSGTHRNVRAEWRWHCWRWLGARSARSAAAVAAAGRDDSWAAGEWAAVGARGRRATDRAAGAAEASTASRRRRCPRSVVAAAAAAERRWEGTGRMGLLFRLKKKYFFKVSSYHHQNLNALAQ